MKAATAFAAMAIALAATPVFAQAGGEKGPERIVWAAQKVPESPYTGPNKPVVHVADVLKAHQGQKSWDQQVLLTRDFDGHYVSLAPGETRKITFQLDVRQLGFYNQAMAYVVEPGAVEVMIGSSSEDIRARGTFTITGATTDVSRRKVFFSTVVSRQ